MAPYFTLKDFSELSKKDLNKQINLTRYQLVELQQKVRQASFPVIILLEGVDGAGKHEISNALNEWMDPRWHKTKAYDQPTDVESSRPEFWRYWMELPNHGTTKVILYGWTCQALIKRTKKNISADEFDKEIEKINDFEKTLRDNGALILKFFITLDHEQQHKRLVELSSDELMSWKIKATDWEQLELYDQYMDSVNQLMDADPEKSWVCIDGSKDKTRSLSIAHVIIEKIEERLKAEAKKAEQKRIVSNERVRPKANHFKSVDLDSTLEKKEYKHRLKELQSEISNLQASAYRNGIPSILVFEGWDAGGKGGAIRRIAHSLDSRQYDVIPIAAPTSDELANHYLRRFWKRVPSRGRIAIFDRSWYGRVLVERIEGFATQEEWQRAYEEINKFEQQLLDFGAVVCKFWLHISKDEQLTRFQDREKTPHKSWKLNEEDWRNRDKWDQYLDACEDMFELSSDPVPWNIIPGNQKYFARIATLEAFAKALKARL